MIRHPSNKVPKCGDATLEKAASASYEMTDPTVTACLTDGGGKSMRTEVDRTSSTDIEQGGSGTAAGVPPPAATPSIAPPEVLDGLCGAVINTNAEDASSPKQPCEQKKDRVVISNTVATSFFSHILHESRVLNDAKAEVSSRCPSISTHSGSLSQIHWLWATTSRVASILILLLGVVSATVFIYVGYSGASALETDHFARDGGDLILQLQLHFEKYVTTGNYIHHRCRDRTFSRADFRSLYEYVRASGLDFKALQFDPNVTHAERAAYEEESRVYFAEYYPEVNYTGFVGFETELPSMAEPRSEQDFYFPIHYMEPIEGNMAAIDLDYYSHISRRQTLEFVLDNGEPGLTDRLDLVKHPDVVNRCGTIDPAYGVVLMHPGVALEFSNDTWPRDISSIVICIPDLLGNTLESSDIADGTILYVFDESDSSHSQTKFLGAAKISSVSGTSYAGQHDRRRLEDAADENATTTMTENVSATFVDATTTTIEKTSINTDSVSTTVDTQDSSISHLMIESIPEEDPAILLKSKLLLRKEIRVTPNKAWSVYIVGSEAAYKPQTLFVVIGGVMIIVSSAFLSFWVSHSAHRIQQFNDLQSANESEKAKLILDNARQATKAERELNDFIAHEVRNPVSAAMTACSFVKSAVHQKEPMRDAETIRVVREDVQIIDHSLNFVGDLLRNMLDMHRAADKKLNICMEAVDLRHDIMEPTAGMLYRRGDSVKLRIDCPKNLLVQTDRLRLKQVVLNLGRNSSKFISTGYILLRARVLPVDGTIEISVEDSGSGVPEEKRSLLFNKFQDSLDVLCQGTGVGLFLCKNLVELMDGTISLDDDFDSGVPGFPGTRIVIRLNKAPCKIPETDVSSHHADDFPITAASADQDWRPTACIGNDDATPIGNSSTPQYTLPESQRVLFVDDDAMLRKLFSRSIRRIAPTWTFQEAGSGEAALLLMETNEFDIVFMDMYMASVEKQLLGTETVFEMRNRGIEWKIFGLSANDKEEEFLAAGADGFVFKPFPCKADLLRAELGRLLYSKTRAE